MKHKLISLIVCFALAFGTLTGVYAADADETYHEKYGRLLYDLGVTDAPEPDEGYITRAQFVKLAISLPGTHMKTTGICVYKDVDEKHSMYDYIVAASDFGIISKSEYFRPDDLITPNEAIKIAVSLLGYDYMAQASGGYPYGYIQAAMRADILDGVGVSGESFTWHNAYTLLYNTLFANLAEVTYTPEGIEQISIGNNTFIANYRNITIINGIVDGGSYWSKSSATGLGEGMFSISGMVFKSGNFDTDSLIGYQIEAFIDNASSQLVSYYISDTNKTVKLYSEDDVSYSSGKFVYYDTNGNVKNITLPIDAVILYNGKRFEFDTSKIVPDSGSITFISPYGTNSYSTVVIKSYRTVVADRVAKSEYVITDKYGGEALKFKSSGAEFSIRDQNGNAITFDDISVGDVLCAAVSQDGKAGDVVRVTDTLLGTYDGKADGRIYIDGTEYLLTSTLKDKIDLYITMGSPAIFSKDIDGRIADVVSATASNEEIGYLVIAKYIANGMSGKISSRILKTDGKIYDYDFDAAFTVNGNGYKDHKAAYTALKSSDYDSLPCDVIKFSLTDDDTPKVKTLSYAGDEGDNRGLYRTYTIDNTDEYAQYKSGSKAIRAMLFVENASPMFRVPNPRYALSHSIDDDLYTIALPSSISQTGQAIGYKMVGYTTDAESGVASYILMQKNDDDFAVEGVSSETLPAMVSTIKKVIHDDTPCEAIEILNIANSGNPLTVYAENENAFTNLGVSPGDIVRVTYTDNYKFKALEFIYKRGSDKLADGSTLITNSNAQLPLMRVGLSYAYNFKGDVLETVDVSVRPENVTEADVYPLYSTLYTIVRYDEKQKCAVKVDASEIFDYKAFGNDYSKIVYHTRYGDPRTIFIVD